jgi:GNAT superfamily N-acetyltransferase
VISFRAAVPADADAVVSLVNSAYRGESSKRGWTTEADLLGGQRTDSGKVLEMVGDAASQVELGFQDRALVACVYLRREQGRSCYLGMLTVDPVLQAAGLGKLLLERSESLASGWGCRRMRMTVIGRREELIAWYERRGYRRTGRTEPFPVGDPRFGLPKVADLEFQELEKSLG